MAHQDIHALATPSPEKVNKKKPWTDDKLNVQSYADSLTKYISTWKAERLVMSVHGEWGSGKTFMLRRWHQQLINDDYIAVYINAWQDDFQDPLVAIIGQLDTQISSTASAKLKENIGRVWDIISNIGISIGYTGADAGIIVGVHQLNKMLKPEKKSIRAKYKQERKALEELRTALYQLAPTPQGEDQPAKPIVFIIDELDRCRPDYSILMLERIKHLFEPPTKKRKRSPGIRFVLGINQTQLECSIRQLYGDTMDVGNYLRRFLDVELIMHPASPKQYCQYLLKSNKLKLLISNEIGPKPIECISAWIEYMQFSLRQVEHFLRTLCGAWNAIDPNNLVDEHLFNEYAIFFLIALRTKDRNRYQQYKAGEIKAKELIEYFSHFVPMLKSDMPAPKEQCSAYVHMERIIYALERIPGERPRIESALNSMMVISPSDDDIIDAQKKEKEMKQYLANTTIKRDWSTRPVIRDIHKITQVMESLNDNEIDYPFQLVDMFREEDTKGEEEKEEKKT